MAKPQNPKDEKVFKNISFAVTYEENIKREKVKGYLESLDKEALTTKEFEMLLLDLVHDDIFKDDSKKPKS